MKRTHRFPARLIRWTSLCVCFVLVLSCFVVMPVANFDHNPTALAKGQSSSQNANVKKVEPAPPVAGPPAGNLPNLDDVKLRRAVAARAPEPVNSTLRSRRKPIESRRGRKVSDPLPWRPGVAHNSRSLRKGSALSGKLNDRGQGYSNQRRSATQARSHHALLSFLLPQSGPTNVALSTNGAVASASSSYSGCAPSGAQDGDRKGLNYGTNTSWAGASPNFPQWLEIDFNGSKTISEIDVFTLQDNYQNPSEPTETMTFSQHGVTVFDAQYWDGSNWITVPGGSITGNNKVWR